MDVGDQTTLRNRILRNLPHEDFQLLAPSLHRVSLMPRETLEAPDAPVADCFFPEPGVVSIIAQNGDGERQDVGLVGPEGMTGLVVVIGADRCPHHGIVQVPGRAWRLPAQRLAEAIQASPRLHALLLRYAHAFAVQVAGTALANGRYGLEARLARWLLMAHDRADREDLPLTHEAIAQMLGVRRAGVTTALHKLEGSGTIRAVRGSITILDRGQLEQVAGASYGRPEAEYARLFGASAQAGLRI